MRFRSSIVLLLSLSLFWTSAHAQTPSSVGGFSRMGLGARGIALGNALTAVADGEVPGYYNPALPSFSSSRTVSASFGLLSLDRYLNTLSLTQALKPHAGLSLSVINAGVRHIDGRDRDGNRTEEYSTTENQFSLAFSNRISDVVAIGLGVKVYYAKLFEEVSSTTVGFDIGALIHATDELTIGLAIKEIGSKYRWDTSPIYGTDGKSSTDHFPVLKKIGVAYRFTTFHALLSAEYESSNQLNDLARVGLEYDIIENVTLRGGIDRISLEGEDPGAKMSLGFAIRNSFESLTPVVSYAFVAEPIAPGGIHIIMLSMGF